MKRRAGHTTRSRATIRARIAGYESWLAEHEEGLILVAQDGELRIEGPVSVDIGAGVRKPYTVSINFPAGDPFALPTVFDIGNHFPPGLDRHVVPSDTGPAWWCMWFSEDPEYDPGSEDALPRLVGLIRGFVYRQLIFDDRLRQGHPHPWPGREWAHGEDAYDEWVGENVGDIARTALPDLLPYVRGAALSWNKRCPCASGQKAGLCHFDQLQRLRSASQPHRVERALLRLMNRESNV